MPNRTWRRRDMLASGVALAGMSSASAAAAQELPGWMQRLGKAAEEPPPPVVLLQPGRQSFDLAGYSKRFDDVRQRLNSGRFEEAINLYMSGAPTDPAAAEAAEKAEADAARAAERPQGEEAVQADVDVQATKPLFDDKSPFLSNSELALIRFDLRDFAQSQTHLETALAAGEPPPPAQSRLGRLGRGLGRLGRSTGNMVMRSVGGRGDFGPYRKRDYESVLHLNYLSLNFLINGDRRAYNVARRSAVEQGVLREKFAERIAEAKSKADQAESDTQSKGVFASVIEAFSPEFAAFTSVANRVPEAYVNPVGPYLSGVIQEIVSLEQPSLRGNARAAYSEAADLAQNKAQLRAAATAMESPATPGQRVVHVLVSEGFAPAPHLLRFGLQLDDQVLPIRMRLFKPIGSRFERLQVHYASGAGRTAVARLDPIGDFEAIIQRDQEDRRLITLLDIVTASLRDAYVAELSASTEQLFGVSLASVPDMRSWNSLPRRFHVARIVLPQGVTSVRLAGVGPNGRAVAQADVPIEAGLQQTMVYARATNDAFLVGRSQRLWVDGIDAA